MTDLVEQTFCHSELWHRAVTVTLDGRAAIERVIRINWWQAALTAGAQELPPIGALPVLWSPLPEMELIAASRVPIGVNGRPDEAAFYDATPDELAAEETKRRAWWAGVERGTVEGVVVMPAERPGLRGLTESQFERLRAEGQQALVEQRSAVGVCGGVLRRHQFPPREVDLLRTGELTASRCNDCGATVERAELLLRAALEAENGTCPLDGDALRSDGSCLTCGG